MQLRKICNHPFVFEEVERAVNPDPMTATDDSLWRSAGKFELLDRILPKYFKTGHRLLIFFQMTTIMHIMEDYLIYRRFKYLRLDGSTKADDRSTLLKLFNAPNSEYFIFLLSTRAGGLGLNLQTADTVVIFDSDWNPHQDLQAQDRAHRIGQTKEVRILRLITENSVEERVLSTAHLKLEMDGKVIQAGRFDDKSTAAEREAFLKSILEQSTDQSSRESEEMDDEELNQLLARGDDELTIFRQIDDERNRTSAYGPGKKLDRLMAESELPDIYRNDQLEDELETTLLLGRGARERATVRYADGLTDDQWARAIEKDVDAENAIQKKEKNMEKRAIAKRKRIVGNLEDDSQPASPSAGSDVSSKKRGKYSMASSVDLGDSDRRKRQRTAGEEDEEDNGELVNGNGPSLLPKKSRSRKEFVDPLEPKQRRGLTHAFRTVLDEVLECVDEDDDDRTRADIFMYLPDRKLYVDYYQIVRNPMSFDIIESKVDGVQYATIADFQRDFDRMFDNARLYNEEGSQVYQDASILHVSELPRVIKLMCLRSLLIKDWRNWPLAEYTRSIQTMQSLLRLQHLKDQLPRTECNFSPPAPLLSKL